jgi:Flp pilus assembly protein TadB
MERTIRLLGLAIDPRLLGTTALAGLGLLLIGWVVLTRWNQRQLSRRRVLEPDEVPARAGDGRKQDQDELGGFLRRWLFLAGYRGRNAPALFVAACVASIALGALAALALVRSGLTDRLIDFSSSVPGGIGDLTAVILLAAPWILFVLCAALPLSLVRASRRRIVLAVEQDLPITLELLATMSESGQAFDSALARVLEARRDDRPLTRELRAFQLEALAGVSRVRCFRRLSRRIAVTSVGIFVSALVQAEQVGAGFAGVLRTQADDLRNRRRERANALAEALPVKLIFPLVICFLPGIFVTTLGPTFMQFLKLAESMSGR